MASRFICGFDDYDSTGCSYEWNRYSSVPPTVASGLTGSCLKFVGGGSGGIASITPFPEGKASVFFGFRMMFTAIPLPQAILSISDATREHLVVSLQASGALTVARSNTSPLGFSTSGTLLGTSSPLAIGLPYYVEFEITINDTAGVVKLYLNGNPTPDLSVTSADTQNAGTSAVCTIGWQWNHATYILYIDDIYCNDTTGSKNTGLEGDVQVRSHFPNTNGNSSQWDRSTGADQYATIDDNPQSTTDYNSTSTLNEVDTVNVESLADTGATIKAVQVNLLAKKTTSGTAAIVPVHRVDSVDYPHATNLYVPTEWVYLRQSYDQQADGTDWNETDFNATEVGYKKTA